MEKEFKELRSQLRATKQEIEAKDELIKELKSAPKQVEPSADMIMERNYLKSQLESLKAQLDDNKSVQEALVTALQSRTLDSSRSESKDPAKHLSMALEKTEERCHQLEQKIQKLKKYQKMVKCSSSLQCKMCGKNFGSSVFSAHTGLCEQTFEQANEAGQYSIIVNQIVVRDDTQDQKPFTEYVITVNYKGRTWTISRRYKNFAMLHSTIQREYPNIELPDTSNLFPTQTGSLFNSKPVMRMEDRRKANQDYLTGLASISCIKNSATFKKFLGSDQHFPEEMIEKASLSKSSEKSYSSRKKEYSDDD